MRALFATLSLLLLSPHVAAQPASCDALPPGSSGCAFRAVTLANPLLDQATFPFTVELFNPHDASASVSVTGGALGATLTMTVAARSTLAINLPWVAALSTSTGTLEATDAAYRITTSRPVTAMQWNARAPFDGPTLSSVNDGSLLRPEHTAATTYRVVAWPTQILGESRPGHVAIVALADGTAVSIAASAIQAGAGLAATGGTVMLDDGDVLFVSSAVDAGADLSGALVTSDKPVLAFAGHVLANVPSGSAFADHLEESLPPVDALGTEHLVVRPAAPPGTAVTARHFVKIVGHSATTLATSPAVVGAPTSVDAGQAVTFEATTDFRLTSSAPVLVASFLEGSERFGGGSSFGDPSQTIVMPVTQATSRIDFVAPAIHAPATALVVAPTGAAVMMDGATVGGWSAIGTTGFSFAQVALAMNADAHTATGTAPFTLTVHAYPTGGGTSYAYPGGFELQTMLFADGFEAP